MNLFSCVSSLALASNEGLLFSEFCTLWCEKRAAPEARRGIL